MRRPFVLFFLILSLFSSHAQNVAKGSIPKWVTQVEFGNGEIEKNQGGFSYLLLDFQDNIHSQEQYIHYAVKVLNADGIQQMSDISASFDPAFQTLVFHKVKIVRNGRTIEKLANSTINTFQRETNLERALYDGSLTAVINLTDVRDGDIIEYSYTIKGFNPVNKGNYSAVIYQEYTLPVHRIYSRLVSSSNNPIEYQLIDGATEPNILDSAHGKEYIWDTNGKNNTTYDTNTPYWYNVQKRISVSTFTSWKAVVELASELYTFSPKKLENPIKNAQKSDSKENLVIDLVRFVQDEVRYLGFESGIGAYKPNSPEKVLSRRYGDCKDKSLLLANLLQDQGLVSYPFLVNTQSGKNLPKLLPGHNVFDHCIVYFEFEGKEYFVDPTISNQGGNLENLSGSDYGNGLLLKKGQIGLKKMPPLTKSKLKIAETIIVDSIGGEATFLVESKYFGSKADQMRSYFKTNSSESINQEFLNYYSSLYPTITATENVSVKDDLRDSENSLVIKESYKIDSFWTQSDTDNYIYCETYPLVLQSLLNYTQSAKRNMPYYLGAPFEFEQETNIHLPEKWTITREDSKMDKKAYAFEKETNLLGNSVSVAYRYALKEEVIEGTEVPSFLSDNDKIKDQLGYQLSYLNSPDAGYNLSTASILIALFTSFLGIFMAIKLYKGYNPVSRENCEGKPIGGWLILPAIGLTITPFSLLAQTIAGEYFDQNTWSSFRVAGYEHASLLEIYMGFELFYNIALTIFTILLIVLFYTRRTSLPNLIIIFYAMNLIVSLLSSILVSQVLPENIEGLEDDSYFKDTFRSLVGAAIWIPYFLKSERVKSTFCKTYKT